MEEELHSFAADMGAASSARRRKQAKAEGRIAQVGQASSRRRLSLYDSTFEAGQRPQAPGAVTGGGDGVAAAADADGGGLALVEAPAALYQPHLPDVETGRVEGARAAEALPVTWGSHSRAGDDPIRSQRENQDAFIVEDCFCEDRYQLFAAVMDGHGPNGANVALFARDQLAEACIERKKRLQQQPGEVLLEAHAAVAAKLRGPENEIDQYVSGTSSLCVLVQPTCIWFANLGDCRAVIGQVRQPIRSELE